MGGGWRMKKVRIIILFCALVFAASVAIGGLEKESKTKARSKDDIYSQVELFADTISILRSDYVEEVDSKKLIYGAMKGMLDSLDDYSEFMPPEEFNEMKVETKGEFGGIGIEVTMRDGVITVITPMVGSPAELSGVMAVDKIVKIDGKTTKNMALADAVKMMRGKPGTEISLTVWREKDGKVLDIKIKRAVIKMRSIKRAEVLEKGVGYIRLVEFQENTARDLEEALKKLESLGVDSLILDLRNNPGGLLERAVDVSEKFLTKDKMIVSIKGRDPAGNLEFKSKGRSKHPDYPLIVLVNEGSASASEIVAGAIQDNKRGLILGMKTFGKASVQTVIPLKDGSAVRFTTAYYYTPSGKMIKEQGIVPDVVVEAQEYKDKKPEGPDELFEKLEEKDKAVKKEPAVLPDLKKDNQLQEALNLIKAMKIYKDSKL
jgi:carboxyl-terminal processing protease